MSAQKMKCAVEKYGFGNCWPEIEIGLQNEVLLSPGESKFDDLPIGSSKQGGAPDLPPHIDWPKYSRRGIPGHRNTSKPMTFLLQLRCADLKPFAPRQFPDHGLLSFFVAIEQNELVRDNNEMPIGRVLYLPGSVAEMLAHAPFPRGLYFGNRLPPCSLKIESSTSIAFDALNEVVERHFGYSQETHDRVWDFYRQEIIPTGCHKLFGPPTMLEWDIIEETRLAAKTTEPPESDTYRNTDDDWLLLLEFDLAELATGVLADQNGRLYSMIRREDLAACRFDRTCLLHDT
jgi:hypothetical protein